MDRTHVTPQTGLLREKIATDFTLELRRHAALISLVFFQIPHVFVPSEAPQTNETERAQLEMFGSRVRLFGRAGVVPLSCNKHIFNKKKPSTRSSIIITINTKTKEKKLKKKKSI